MTHNFSIKMPLYSLMTIAFFTSCYRPETDLENITEQVLKRQRGVEITIEELEKK